MSTSKGATRPQLSENELRRLLEVGRALVSELDVESVLHHVLETSRELTAARDAALGILDEHKRELERAVRGLEATATLARSVGYETDLERVLELIAKRGRALVDARSVLVLLEDSSGLHVACEAGESVGGALGARLRAEGTLAAGVLATGAGERVPSLADRVGHGLEAITRGATSAIVAPLGFRGRARGVLVALDRDHGSPVFDADDEHLLTSFAASAAIAIATAQSVEVSGYVSPFSPRRPSASAGRASSTTRRCRSSGRSNCCFREASAPNAWRGRRTR